MKIDRLTIQGFRSFAGAQELDLSALRPGLYHVAGVNEIEPELEGNGAGKSSLFEAIYWTLYGTTSRGLKAGNVQNWYSQEKCAGVVDLQTAAGPLSVVRVWQSLGLSVVDAAGERPIDQPQLEQLLGMRPDTMLFAIYFAQFTRSFVDLKPAEQTELFTSVLQLEVWDTAATTAAGIVKDLEKEIQWRRTALARLEGEAEALLAVDHEAMADAWDEEQSTIIVAAQGVVDDAQQQVNDTLAAMDKATKAAETFRTLRQQEMAAGQALAAQAALVGRLSREIDALKTEARAATVAQVCRTCGQKLPAAQAREHLQEELSVKAQELADLEREADRLRGAHTAVARRMTKHADAERAAGAAESKHSAAARFLTAAVKQLAQMRNAVNPHAAAAQAAAARGEGLVAEMDEALANIMAGERDAAAAEFWVKGFREIRLALIRESLAQLEIEANEALFQLGLRDWSLAFHVDRENKSGGVTNKFGVTVKAPHTAEPVPWEAWSGGESQRLRLSCAMGFANLVCARAGVQPNVEFWDEPSQWLSQSGIEDLLQVLADRALRLKKVILLADHRSLEFGGFAGTIKLVKDRTGTHIAPPV